MKYKQINWLASYPKSGNTWVRCFLEAYFTGQIDINDLNISVQDDVAPAYETGNGTDVIKMPIDIQQLARPMAMLRLVERYNKEGLKVPLFIKSHAPCVDCNSIELLPQSLTKSTIYIVRDPRDVLPSFAKHMGVELDVAMEWMNDKYRQLNPSEYRVADYVGDWSSHATSFMLDKFHNTLLVKYEDMRLNPIREFQKILTHIGIDPIFKRVKQALELVELDKLRAKEAKNGFKESSPHAKDQFFGKGEVGAYKDKLTTKQLYFIERNFGSVMKKLGYLGKNRKAA